MKYLLAALAVCSAAIPAQASDPEFQARKGGYTIAFSDIARNDDTSWKAAAVTFTGPNGYIQYFDATFEGTDHGTIAVEGDPCTISIETVADANGNDAGWAVSMTPGDDEKEGCNVLPKGLPGTYQTF